MSHYKEVKNVMHNEMGITKEEIRSIIRESIEFEVKRIVEGKQQYIEKCIDEYTKEYIEAVIRNGLSDGGRLLFGFKERVSSALSSEIGKFISTKMDFEIKLKDE
jgi:hypothetical protein